MGNESIWDKQDRGNRQAVWAFVLFWIVVVAVYVGIVLYNQANWLTVMLLVVPLVHVPTVVLAVVVVILSISALRNGCSRRFLAAFPLWICIPSILYILYCIVGMAVFEN